MSGSSFCWRVRANASAEVKRLIKALLSRAQREWLCLNFRSLLPALESSRDQSGVRLRILGFEPAFEDGSY